MTWVWYALDPGDGPHKYKDIHVSDPSPTTVAFLLCLTLYTAAIPARILWDVGFGCSMITRIHELREQATAAVDTEKNAALLALTRRTILYIVVSGLLNLFIHIPQLKIIPFDPVVRATCCCMLRVARGHGRDSLDPPPIQIQSTVAPTALTHIPHAYTRAHTHSSAASSTFPSAS